MAQKIPKILFFIAGGSPTEQEALEASQMGIGKVPFRNVQFVYPDSPPEVCDGVAGIIKPPYHQMPRADVVLKDYWDTVQKSKELLESKFNNTIAPDVGSPKKNPPFKKDK